MHRPPNFTDPRPIKGAIPAHLTGHMRAQSWGWLYKQLEPFPGQPPIDETPAHEKGK